MAAAKVRSGLQPGQPILNGRPIAWSKNRVRTQPRLVRLNARIANILADTLHRLATMLVERFDVHAIENLIDHVSDKAWKA